MYEILMTNIQIRQQAKSAEWTKIEIDLTSKLCTDYQYDLFIQYIANVWKLTRVSVLMFQVKYAHVI